MPHPYQDTTEEKVIDYAQIEKGLDEIGAALRDFRDLVVWGIEKPTSKKTKPGLPLEEMFKPKKMMKEKKKKPTS
jgi:hypothetical protein